MTVTIWLGPLWLPGSHVDTIHGRGVVVRTDRVTYDSQPIVTVRLDNSTATELGLYGHHIEHAP